jgi:MFS family permease
MAPPDDGRIRRLALAGFVSTLGSEMAFVALAFVIYDRTGSALWLATVFLLTFGLPGLFAPVAGVLADRFDRKRVMIASDLASAAAFTILVFTQDRVAMIAVAFVGSVVEMPFGTGLSAALPNLVATEHLARANSTLSLARKLGGVAGPVLGGVLVNTIGGPKVFALNAASFLVSSGLVLSVHGRFSSEHDETEPDEHRGAAAGLRFVRARPKLLAILIAWSITFFAIDIVLVAQLPLAESVGAGSVGFGVILAAWGVGQVVGAYAGRVVTRRTEGRALTLEMSMGAVALGSVAAVPRLGVAVAAEGVAAVFDQVGTIAGYSMIQRETPDAVRGRVFAAYFTAGLLANSVAFVVGGFILEATGPRGVYAIAAASLLVATGTIVHAFGRHSVVAEPITVDQ